MKHCILCTICVDDSLLKGPVLFPPNENNKQQPVKTFVRHQDLFYSYSNHFAHQLDIFLRLKVSCVYFAFLWN